MLTCLIELCIGGGKLCVSISKRYPPCSVAQSQGVFRVLVQNPFRKTTKTEIVQQRSPKLQTSRNYHETVTTSQHVFGAGTFRGPFHFFTGKQADENVIQQRYQKGRILSWTESCEFFFNQCRYCLGKGGIILE